MALKVKHGSIWDYVCTYVLLPTLLSKRLEEFVRQSKSLKLLVAMLALV
jgi:hypothetical protein